MDKMQDKPLKGISRREALRGAGYAGAVAAGVGVRNILESAAYHETRKGRRLKTPIRHCEAIQGNAGGLVDKLKAEGCTGFMLLDNHHHSAPIMQSVNALLKAQRDMEIFIECPEDGKDNAETRQILSGRDTGRSDEADAIRKDLVKAVKDRGGVLHATDTWQGPDHVHLQSMIRAANGELLPMFNVAQSLERVSEGMDCDVVFRNRNMSEAISRVMRDKPRGTPYAFIVGSAHGSESLGDDSVQALLRARTGVKVAVLDFLPVKQEEFAGKLYREKAQPQRYVLTVLDPEHGVDVSKQGSVQLDNGETLLLNQSRGRGLF